MTITGLAIGNLNNMTSTNLGPIVDTGTPFLLLPPSYCEEYYSSLGVFEMGSYHGESGLTYPCNATLPDLYLKIGGYTATIKGELLSGPEVSDGCKFFFSPLSFEAADTR
jgi:aspergillopepsin I